MVTIPTWIITLVIPLFASILIAIIANIKATSKNNGKFETCIANLDKRLDSVDNRLDRVEIKLDNFILKEV